MEMNPNKFTISEVRKLAGKPDKLILCFEYLIDIICKGFITSGQIKFSDFDDLKQGVCEQLIRRLPKITLQYQGKARFESYLSVVIQNIAREVLRGKKQIYTTSLEHIDHLKETTISSEDKMTIQSEIERLERIFHLYHRKHSKVILCLKVRFRIPVIYEDFYSYCNTITKEEFNSFDSLSSAENILQKEKYLYDALIKIFNRCERKNNTSDSLRKFIKSKINEIIKLLNGNPPTSYYTEETLQILVEKYLAERTTNSSDSDNLQDKLRDHVR